jgi:hypothetical protein
VHPCLGPLSLQGGDLDLAWLAPGSLSAMRSHWRGEEQVPELVICWIAPTPGWRLSPSAYFGVAASSSGVCETSVAVKGTAGAFALCVLEDSWRLLARGAADPRLCAETGAPIVCESPAEV